MRKVFVGFVLAAAVVATQAWAQDQGKPEGRDAGDRIGGGERIQRRPMLGEREGDQEGMMLQGLLKDPDVAIKAGISEQQMTTLRTGFDGMKPEFERLRKELEKAGVDQAALMTKASPDEAAMMTAVEHTGAIRTELAKMQMKSLLLVRRTLSPEQIEKVKSLARERMRERFGDRMRDRRDQRDRGKKDGQAGGNQPRPPPPPPSAPDSVL
jgi:Spy/CpxP family protein refolding chaperone